jgi:hypothetical protein
MQVYSGHNNWLSINLQLEKDQDNCFDIAFQLTSPLQNLKFQEAADYTARLISEKYNNIHLLLSGGLDSEYVAKVFVRNNLKFTPVILVNYTNIAEVWYAFKFCQEHNLAPMVLNYSDSYQSHTKFLKMLYDLSLKLKLPPNLSIISNFVSTIIKDANILTGCGDLPGGIDFNDYKFFLSPITDDLIVHGSSFYLNLQKNHPGPFFTYTPEIVKSFVLEIDYKKNIQSAKAELYGILPRSKIIYDLHSISESKILKTMIEDRLYNMQHLENNKIIKKDFLLDLLK